jgi:NAD(P)-dependent dehydrogenase (short-subunit alcohol dehydrogenase family)
MQFEGKRAVITGAGSGIGRALAIEGSEKGIRLALMGRRREALDQTLSKLTGTGHFVVTGDITKAADRLSLMVAVEKQWGGLDILVNNAGVIPFGPLIETTDDQLQAAIDTNLLGPMALVREALPLLRREKGRVVNIGSVLGDIPASRTSISPKPFPTTGCSSCSDHGTFFGRNRSCSAGAF